MTLFAIAGCGKTEAIETTFGVEQCVRVSLSEAPVETPIVGAEDLAVDARNGRLLVSAYDRRAVENAARARNGSAPPSGGIYEVSLDALLDSASTAATATRLIEPSSVAGGLRPHGVDFDAAAGDLAFINRAYHRVDGRWRMKPSVMSLSAEGEVSEAGSAPCSANDVVAGPRLFVSFDHAGCDARAIPEDVLGLKRSGVMGPDGDAALAGVGFANGLSRLPDGRVALAATREKALILLRETASGLSAEQRIKTPGGPDNISIAADGGIISAVHPSLFRMGLARRLGIGDAPSRIIKADPATGRVEVLFDDPSGSTFSAATAAVEWRGSLIAGSVLDSGLLVCRAPG